MSFGIRVWDGSGAVVFDADTLSMRVVTIVQVRGGLRDTDLTVAVPAARAGQVPIVLQLAHLEPQYDPWYLGYAPLVAVSDGSITLSNFKSAFRGDISSGSRNPLMDCNVDIALVTLG